MDAIIALMLIEALLILLDIAIFKVIRFISPSLHVIYPPTAVDDNSRKENVVSISTVSSPSLDIIVAPPPTKYDVFISFRGEDTRHNFSSYLYQALCNVGIKTFMDHKLQKGEQISPFLSRTIEESEISVIVFSNDYASSSWCMNELIQILECMDKYGRIVIPIFYNVDPSNVRKQNGSFGDGFAKLKQRFEDKQVQKWRNALIQSTNLSGWDSKNIRPDFKLIKKIVADISSKLNCESSCHLEGLVGIDHRIEKIVELLRDVRIVGIWGMGGIGKTTLAKAVFHKLKAEFEAFYFVENVREQLARIGLDGLKETCLRELLKYEDIGIYNMESSLVKRRLQQKKIILVLDDVDNLMTVHDLNVLCDWLGEGSRIIITSRDMQVLKNASASEKYHVQELDSHHALRLFSLKAFKQNEPSTNYVELSKLVVDYCQGNPLAIIVLGSFLHGRGKEEWESVLGRLNQALRKDIFDVLELSFEGLDDLDMKNMFLDLAHLLSKPYWKISVNLIGHLYDSSAHMISVLKERSLILVYANGDVTMHALLKELGREISRQQFMSNPKNPVRLWRHDDVYQFFKNNKGTEVIRFLSLDMCKIKRITLEASWFQKMRNLIFLKLYKSDRRKHSNVNIVGDLDYLPEGLNFIYWEECPLPYVPLHFCAENLIDLEMPYSHLQQLWEGNQHFPNLQAINLQSSTNLVILPDLSQAPNIEKIKLAACENLGEIHSSTILGKLKYLHLDLYKEPRHVNIGGTIKGGSSGLVKVFKFLDLNNFSLHKMTMKLFVSDDGNIIYGIRYKHEQLPFKQRSKWRDNREGAKLKLGTQTLVSLLPFVTKVYWLDGQIEFGNSNQHFDYDHCCPEGFNCFYAKRKRVIEEEERVESGVVVALRREGVNVDDDKEEEELMGEVLECCCSSNSDSNKLTRAVPNIITRWSLLTKLRLKKSDMMMMMMGHGGGSIPQVSVLKSVAHSNLQILAHVTLSLDHLLGNWPTREFLVQYRGQEEGDENVDLFCLLLDFHSESAGFHIYGVESVILQKA